MMLWTVFQEGVYRHGFGGVFDELRLAIIAADQIAASDRDDYHTYEVHSWTLNETDPGEGSPLYVVRRSEALAKLAAPSESVEGTK